MIDLAVPRITPGGPDAAGPGNGSGRPVSAAAAACGTRDA